MLDFLYSFMAKKSIRASRMAELTRPEYTVYHLSNLLLFLASHVALTRSTTAYHTVVRDNEGAHLPEAWDGTRRTTFRQGAEKGPSKRYVSPVTCVIVELPTTCTRAGIFSPLFGGSNSSFEVVLARTRTGFFHLDAQNQCGDQTLILSCLKP